MATRPHGETLARPQPLLSSSPTTTTDPTISFYGPFAASLPSALTPILDQYEELFKFEMGGDEAYLFHPPQSGFDRAMESSSWSQWVSRLFQRHAGVAIAPKTLRSIFITWLRSNTDAPEILKSAAHAQKHSEARQASDDYDQQADDRLVTACEDGFPSSMDRSQGSYTFFRAIPTHTDSLRQSGEARKEPGV